MLACLVGLWSGHGAVATGAGVGVVSELTPDRSIPNPTNRSGELFGISLALMEGGQLAVGAQDANSGTIFASGVVHLFDSVTGDLDTTISNPTPSVSARFGGSVAAVDANRLLVGASGGSVGQNRGGAAYVVDVGASGATISVPNQRNSSLDEFGFAVDVLASGLGLVGAYRDDERARDAGAVHLVDLGTGAIVRSLDNPTPNNEDFFGFAVAGVGSRAVVGAHLDDAAGVDAGAVHIYTNPMSGVLSRTLLPPAPTTADMFGQKLFGVGDDDVLISAPGNDTGATNAGAAYLYSAASGALRQAFYHPEPAAGDRFGSAAAVVGGGEYTVIGASLRNSEVGVAYVFRTDTGRWIARIPNPDPVNVRNFGGAIEAAPGGVFISGFGLRGGVFYYQIPEPTCGLLTCSIAFGLLIAHARGARHVRIRDEERRRLR
jgi:hypothetical protein